MAGATSLQMSWLPLKKRKGGPLGLKNLGNTCYLNSVLQCLTYTPPLANFCLLNNHSSSCVTINGSGNGTCPFCLVEKRISRSLTIDLVADSPVRIHNCLSIFAKHFRHGCQEDAHEFLRYVIEACNSVCVKLHKLLSVTKTRTRQDHQKASKEEPRTVVKDIFGGVLQSQVRCLSCKAESNKLDDMMDLSLDVLQIGSLKEAMCRFFQPEVLDGNNKYKCEKCKKLSAARKQMSIFEAPNVLVVQLKRFENIHGGKIDRHISFGERLELAGHMCQASKDPKPEYQLYALIVHAGYSQDSGHYYSYVKDANGKWFCCNDANITAVSSHSVLLEKAYILFYARQNSTLKIKRHGDLENGHKAGSLASPVQPCSASLELAKEKLPVKKCDSSNVSPCSANRDQVKFSISKPVSNGHNQKVPVGSNGKAERLLACNNSGQTKRETSDAHIRVPITNAHTSSASGGMMHFVSRETGSENRSDKLRDSNRLDTSNAESQNHLSLGKGGTVQSSVSSVEQSCQAEPQHPNGVADGPEASAGYGHEKNMPQENARQGRSNGLKRKMLDSRFASEEVPGYQEYARHPTESSYDRYGLDESELQTLKQRMADDSRAWLLHSGWCDSVRDSFRAVKRERLSQNLEYDNMRWSSFEPGPYIYRSFGGAAAWRQWWHFPPERQCTGYGDSSWMLDGFERAREVSRDWPSWTGTIHGIQRPVLRSTGSLFFWSKAP